jgi:FlaA1/EpsC-like NDP-sugar epimerase
MTTFLSRQDAATLATGRDQALFTDDVQMRRAEIETAVRGERVLVIGGAGSIGAATVAELSRFNAAALHVVDLNENGLTELVRDLRSRAEGLKVDDFRTLPLDFGSPVMHRYLRDVAPYAVVLNFAAIKHVRSEKDSYSLLQMLETNVVKAYRLLEWLVQRGGTKRYFSVSTDKAANPVNLMGASKRLMEHATLGGPVGRDLTVTSARFANVAFSAGSLLEGWLLRLEKRQPLAVPRATRRYFLSLREAGQLCLLAATCAPDRLIVIPDLDADKHLIELEGVARALLHHAGFTPAEYEDETDARGAVADDLAHGRYPMLLTPLDTSGEKPYEEFVGEGESIVDIGLRNLKAVRYEPAPAGALQDFQQWLDPLLRGEGTTPPKRAFISALAPVVRELRHVESDKQLDKRM